MGWLLPAKVLGAVCNEDHRRAVAATVLTITPAAQGGSVNVQGETQKGMDVFANELFVSALRPHVAAMASDAVGEKKDVGKWACASSARRAISSVEIDASPPAVA